jgi:hypothetical protein
LIVVLESKLGTSEVNWRHFPCTKYFFLTRS